MSNMRSTWRRRALEHASSSSSSSSSTLSSSSHLKPTMPPLRDPTSTTHQPSVTMSISSTSSSTPSLCNDADSWSSSSSTPPPSPTSSKPSLLPPSKQSPSISHLLMPYPPPDPALAARAARGARFRRRFHLDIFEGVDVDWRSLPAVEDCDLHSTHLLARPHLRCDASRGLRLRIIDEYRPRSKHRVDDADVGMELTRLQRLGLAGLPHTAVQKLKSKSKAAATRCAELVKVDVKTMNAPADGVRVVDMLS